MIQGDITVQAVDAIANAANAGLRGGGGVDGAIHRAGGPSIMEECRRIGGCPTGTAVVTTAGALAARMVVHTAGPVYRGGGAGEAELLRRCYRSCLEAAVAHGARSIAFPSISTGVYGYPVCEAAQVALSEVGECLRGDLVVGLVRFVLYDAQTFAAYRDALIQLFPDR